MAADDRNSKKGQRLIPDVNDNYKKNMEGDLKSKNLYIKNVIVGLIVY